MIASLNTLKTDQDAPVPTDSVKAAGIRPVDQLVLELLRRQEG